MDKKEIVRRLRRCANFDQPCDGCVYADTIPPRCVDLLRDAADVLEDRGEKDES